MPGTAGAWGAGPRERRVGVGRPGGPEASTRDGAEGLAGGVAGGAVKAAERAEASTPAGEEATRGLGAPGGGAREREEPSSSTDPRGTRFRGEERTFEWAWFAGPREAPGETKAEERERPSKLREGAARGKESRRSRGTCCRCRSAPCCLCRAAKPVPHVSYLLNRFSLHRLKPFNLMYPYCDESSLKGYSAK